MKSDGRTEACSMRAGPARTEQDFNRASTASPEWTWGFQRSHWCLHQSVTDLDDHEDVGRPWTSSRSWLSTRFEGHNDIRTLKIILSCGSFSGRYLWSFKWSCQILLGGFCPSKSTKNIVRKGGGAPIWSLFNPIQCKKTACLALVGDLLPGSNWRIVRKGGGGGGVPLWRTKSAKQYLKASL